VQRADIFRRSCPISSRHACSQFIRPEASVSRKPPSSIPTTHTPLAHSPRHSHSPPPTPYPHSPPPTHTPLALAHSLAYTQRSQLHILRPINLSFNCLPSYNLPALSHPLFSSKLSSSPNQRFLSLSLSSLNPSFED